PVSPQLPYSPSLPQYPPQFPSDLLFPYLPVPTHPVPTTTLPPPHRAPAAEDHSKSPVGPYYPQYYHQKPDHPVFTAIPVTQAPVPRPSFPPKQPLTPQHQTSSFYPPMSYYHPLPPYLLPVQKEPEKPAASPDMFYQTYHPKLHPFSPHYPKIPSPPNCDCRPRLNPPLSSAGLPQPVTECNLHSEYRLPCGSSSISETQCLSMGCCFNKHPPACYYPMDAAVQCTIDRHMIFSVPASLTDPPLSTALLAAASNSTCRPQRVTPEYALFKIPMDGCGTRRVVVGKTVVYMVEITNTIQTVSLNYGTITRDSPVRLLVECRYVPGTVLGVSYVVKTPTLGPDVHTQGVFGVQLRIAKELANKKQCMDAQYTSYYPQYHQPLHMLLGKPLHLEVRLLSSPDPSLVLLVHFCVAYPRSGNAAWVLLYNGCPNPLDPAPPETVLSDPTPPSPQSQTRRFTIRTFQFLPDGEFQDMDEEIYFMCSTEICSPRDGPCVEGCFGQ
uniref:Zmp:0000001145 n=1 Tax=Poecilia formosa TaxID=48698 RepID=A0A087Y8G3_POEFO